NALEVLRCARDTYSKSSLREAGRAQRELKAPYLSHRSVGPMITPTMLCSTGVHSIPNPRAGWTVGDPKTRMVAVTGADSAADDWTGCPTKGSGPTVVVKGTAEDPVCSWENAGET